MKWKELLQYPKSAPYRAVLMMETLEAVYPIPEEGSRYARFGDWIDGAMQQGIITTDERRQLYADVGPHF